MPERCGAAAQRALIASGFTAIRLVRHWPCRRPPPLLACRLWSLAARAISKPGAITVR